MSAHRALLRGAHRQLCIYSHHYRGTPERPGLVFGLVRGGSCNGMAFEVDPANWIDVRDYLRERELVSGVYNETVRAVNLADGRSVKALTYMVDEDHVQYAGNLDQAEQAVLIKSAQGSKGPNRDYVINTADHLTQMGIVDHRLETLSVLLKDA